MIYNDLIYDVGLHIGQDTAFYLKKGFRVVAIEANPILAHQVAARFADACGRGFLRVLNVGVGSQTGRFPFYVNTLHSEWSSFDKETGNRGCEAEVIEVETLPLEDIVRAHGVPYYMKIDIEGFDMMALESVGRLSERPRYISAENGQPEMLELMCSLGYSRFKFINQATVPAMRCPSPAREGLDVDYQFEFGASGPFGEDTIGVWRSRDEVLAEILAYWNTPNRDPNIHGWYDLHAQISDQPTGRFRFPGPQQERSARIARDDRGARNEAPSQTAVKSQSTETYVPHVGWLRHGPDDEVAELLRQGHFEAGEQAFLWLYLRHDSVFIDGGAHVGLFSLIAAKVAEGGRVIAVEPDSTSAKLLRENLQGNSVRNVEVVEAALWDRSGQVCLSRPPVGKSAFASVAEASKDLEGGLVASMTATDLLDACSVERADVMKLDIEGAEPRVVATVEHLTRVGRLPVLIVEFTEDNLERNETSTERLHTALSGLGYTVCDFDKSTLRLIPYQYDSPIWHKNLFAVTRLDDANERLAGASSQTVRIARDILQRASSASKLSELEELATWKLRARDAENYRVWAERTEQLLAYQKELSTQYHRWAQNSQHDVGVVREIAEQNRGWAERIEALLVNEKALTSQYRKWVEDMQHELRSSQALSRDNRGWAERTEGLLAVQKALQEQYRQWAESAQGALDAARAFAADNRSWAERSEALLVHEKALSKQYRNWAESVQRDLEAVQRLAGENRKWAEGVEFLLVREKALSDEYRNWAETAQRDLEVVQRLAGENRSWAERVEALLAREKALSEQYRNWAETAQRDLESVHRLAGENRGWAERSELLLVREKTLLDQYREWAQSAQRELEAQQSLAGENRIWAERAEAMFSSERILSDELRESVHKAQLDLEHARRELAGAQGKIVNLRALATVFRLRRFRFMLKRIVTGRTKPR